MNVPDISVIVITFNDAAHVRQSVLSVLAQTHKNLEVILVDDKSQDDTYVIAQQLMESDSRVRFHRRDFNSGGCGAPRNDGLRLAKGDYIMFLDSDDVLPSASCARLLEVAKSTKAEIVSGQMVRVMLAEGGREHLWCPELYRERRVVTSIDEYPSVIQDTAVTNKMYDRKLFVRTGIKFQEHIHYEDFPFSVETLSAARGIATIVEPVYYWNVYPSVTRSSISNQRSHKKNLLDRLYALALAEEALSGTSSEVVAAFNDRLLGHHLRIYLNDFLISDDGWCRWVLDTIQPRLESIPLATFRRRYLGDQLLYASALVHDVAAVKAILGGKKAGALAGHIFRDGDSAYWAPRGRESRPVGLPLALVLSDVSDRMDSLKAHSDFSYLFEIRRMEVGCDGLMISGIGTDPLDRLSNSRARMVFCIYTKSASSQVSARVAVTKTPEGISWAATVPLPQKGSDSDGDQRLIEMQSFNAVGEVNVSSVRAGKLQGERVQGTGSGGQDDAGEWELVGATDEAARLEYLGVVEPSPKRVVVIGDVSWRGRYHLGDEAMTEVAIDELRDRGLAVTLIAGETELSSEFYGVPCVPVFGFAKQRSRKAREQRLEAILVGAAGVEQLSETELATVAAVKSADAVVIAGGGNMNANGSHHIYERLALTRIARSAGVPVYVSSQTVGPSLSAEDRAQLQEIARYATVFGARERTTAALMGELCDQAEALDAAPEQRALVVRTLDDAILLKPAAHLAELQSRLQLPAEYAVGSFTYHAWSTGLSREEYYRELAGMLDDVVSELGVDVLLLPHMGVLGEPTQSGTDNDVFGHDRIVNYTRSGRVRSLPLISAREVLAVTQEAKLSISTRYHPVVFGAAVGVPAIGIVTSYYSALRMRGALSEYGMESFAIPFEHWGTFGPRAIRAVRDGEFAGHSSAAGARQRAFQTQWWDSIAASITGAGEVHGDDVVDVAPHEWTTEADAALLAVARVAQDGTNMYRMNNMVTVEAHRAELKALQSGAQQSRRELDELRRENEYLREAIGELRHLVRPPGAELRDRVRRKIRTLRGK